MSPGSSTAAANSNNGQKRALIPPNRSQGPFDRPRNGNSKRTLIKSACTACQRRKSRCDGQRPICSRCRALHTECGYNAEEGESRWSALRRKIRTLERERDEARDLLSQIQSKPEIEAYEIYRSVRSRKPTRDMSALIQDVASAVSSSPLQQDQLLRHQYRQQKQGRVLYDQEHEDHHLPQLQQRKQPQALQHKPHQYHQRRQQHKPNPFFQSGYTGTGVANRLPPLRSIVEIPVSGIDPVQQQPALQFQLTSWRQGRKTSQASGTSSDSHFSTPSPETCDRHSLPPKDWLLGRA